MHEDVGARPQVLGQGRSTQRMIEPSQGVGIVAGVRSLEFDVRLPTVIARSDDRSPCPSALFGRGPVSSCRRGASCSSIAFLYATQLIPSLRQQ